MQALTQHKWVLTFLHIEVCRRFGRKVSEAQIECLKTPQVFLMIHGRSSGTHTFSKRGWTSTRSDLLASRKYSICDEETCKNSQLVRKRGRNRDAIHSASNRSIPTRAALEPHATAHVRCVWKCATRESNQFSQQHHSWRPSEICSVSRVRKMCSMS